MKIIAKVDDGVFVAQVSHTEIEKFMGLYYNNMDKIKVGDEIDLGKGYQFHNDTMNALKKTNEFLQANKTVVEAITTGITIAVKALDKA